MDSPLKLLDQSLHIHSISHMLLLKPVAANAREAIAIRHSKASAGVELDGKQNVIGGDHRQQGRIEDALASISGHHGEGAPVRSNQIFHMLP